MTKKQESTLPHVLFLGSTYAGHRTRFENLQINSQADPRLRSEFRRITGWRADGFVERLPVLPTGAKGRIRATFEARPFAMIPRPDVIWTSAREELLLNTWAQVGRLRRPAVLDLDATDAQLERMAQRYFGRAPKRRVWRRAARLQDQVVRRTISVFTPWSTWAADGLRDEGVPLSRIRILPPGVSLSDWKPRSKQPDSPLLRLLFVGGDFRRKGGEMLLDLLRGPLAADPIELDVVSTDAIRSLPPNVRLHRATPNSDRLRGLYASADLFVVPSLAECFGIASVEAMASGLPVIASDVGGARDIVVPGRTGWLIQPTPTDLLAAIRAAQSSRSQLATMGAQGRLVAETRFDGAANDRAVVELCLSLAGNESPV